MHIEIDDLEWDLVQVKKDEVRDRILRASEKLFGERGFAGTSLRGIAGEASVSLANVYNYELPADMQGTASDTPFSPKGIALYAVLAVGLLSFIRPSVFGRYRHLLLIADVVVLGIVHGTLLSLSQLRNMLINGLHGIDHLPLLGLFGLTVLGLLLFTLAQFRFL